MNIKNQLSKLYLSSVLGGLSLTGAWVAILAARGFSLVEIGIAETAFHITSLVFEIPSGILADIFGRKKMLIVSAVMRAIGNVVMIFSGNLIMVCASLAFFATSYNFASGSGDALAYDSMKEAGCQEKYNQYESNQLVIYRLCGGLSTLCAGLALLIGHRIAYGADVLMCAGQITVLSSLCEQDPNRADEANFRRMLSSLGQEFVTYFKESLLFLKNAKWAVGLMFCNSFVGAVDILLLFFLQAKLPGAGLPGWALGPSLFLMELGGIVGARLILRCEKLRYQTVFGLAAAFVLAGVLLEHTGLYPVMILAGFLTALCDDALQVRTNTVLQNSFPSQQRATLISMESFIFSVEMIVLSPLAGILFSHW